MSYNEFLDMDKFMKKSKDITNKVETMYESFEMFRKIWDSLQNEPLIAFLRLDQYFNRIRDSLRNNSTFRATVDNFYNYYFTALSKIIKPEEAPK